MNDILLISVGAIVAYLLSGLRVLREYERAVYFFLGRSWGAKGPGLIFLPPLFAKMQKVSLRVMALDIPPQDVITRDNISIKVNAVLYMRVKDTVKAVIGVENYLYVTSQLAQTTLRSVLGETEMDELLANREKINAILKQIIDARAESWGIEVHAQIGEQRPGQVQKLLAVDDSGQERRRGAKENVFGDRQLWNEIELLIDDADPELERVARARDVHGLAADANLAAVFPIGAAENLHQRRLPGAVLAEQHVHFAAVQRDIDAG